MVNRPKRIRIVGKGHAYCYEKLLEEWYREEKCVDVFITCSSPGKNIDSSSLERESRDLCQQVPANRSVLAAASSVFREIFLQNPVTEEDTRVTLVDYSYRALKSVIEYIYTGSLEFVTENKDQVEALLKDFCIQIPTTAEKIFDQLPPPSVSSTPVPVTPRRKNQKQFEPKIVSTFSVSAKTSGSAPAILRQNNRPVLPAVVQESQQVQQVDLTQSNDDDGNLPMVVGPRSRQTATVPSRQATPSGPPAKIRILSRVVDSPVAPKELHTMDQPSMSTPLGLIKSFPEKTMVFAPTPSRNAWNLPKNVSDGASLTKHYRSTATTIHEVPGIYTPWRGIYHRERHVVMVDPPYSDMPEDPLDTSNVYVPSFANKNVVRTYQERPTGRATSKPTGRMSLAGVRIDSIHQVGNKVHIRTAGEPLISKELELLDEDEIPLVCISPDQSTSRLTHHEHNYSTGDGVDGEIKTVTTPGNDHTEDQDHFKRSLQLVVNEQRRRSRLKHRVESLEDDLSNLKRRASELIGFCRTMGTEAHERDPDYVERKPEPTPRPSQTPSVKQAVPMVVCDVCNKVVKRTWLKHHKMIAHSTERPHLCEECGRSFVLTSQLSNHRLRQHLTQPGNHQCEKCGQTFKFLRYLRRHMSLHAEEKPFQCQYCDKRFRLKTNMTKHVRTHTGVKPYKCGECGKCFTQRTTYVTHSKVHERRRQLGEQRGIKTGSSLQMPRLQCNYCSMTFRLDLFLMLHVAKHTGEVPALPCPTCKQTFPSIKELTEHRKSEHPTTVHACHLCPKVFTNVNNFKFHVHKHSNPDAVKKKYPLNPAVESGPCTCEFCGKVFKNRSSLDYHIKGIHLGGKTLKCKEPDCDKTFTHRPSLEQHMRTHTGERPFKCDQCPSAFKQNQHLVAHLVIHTGERPFSCQHCDKTFPHKTTLYAHMRIHTGKRLLCTYCKKVLPSVAQLQRHEEECPMNTDPIDGESCSSG